MELQQVGTEAAMPQATVADTEDLEGQGRASAKLQGWRLALARIAWVAVAIFSVALFIVAIPASYDVRTDLEHLQIGDPEKLTAELLQLGFTVSSYATYNVILEVTFAAICVTIGTIIFLRKSDDVMALLMAFFLVTFGVGVPNTVDAHAQLYPEWAWLTNLSVILLIVFIFFAFFTFPDGRFVPRWSLWVAISCAALEIVLRVVRDSMFDSSVWQQVLYFILFAATIVSLIVIQVYRYRYVSTPLQRQQTKWVVYGFSTGIGGFIAVYLVTGLISEHLLIAELVRSTAAILFLLLIPISVGIAILRNRLFGIDIIIKRTLVYVPLTAILAGLYAATIALSQKLFIAITGEKSDAAVVLTTLVLTTSFTPIKSGLQGFVDRRFKESPDSVKELSTYKEQVQTFVQMNDSEQMARRLLEKAVKAFNARSGAVYFEGYGAPQPVHTIGQWSEQDTR